MPITIPEILSDLPEVLVLVNKIQSGVSGLPATDRKAEDYSALIVSILPDLARLIDTIDEQAKS